MMFRALLRTRFAALIAAMSRAARTANGAAKA